MNGIRVSLLLLFVSLCPAEMLPLVRGRVLSDIPHLGTDLMAELEDLDRRMPPDRVTVAGDGSFEFRDVTMGRHALRITTIFGDVICEQSADVNTHGTELSIRLPKRLTAHPGGGTVSVRELQRPVPRKAYQAFVAAQRDVESGHATEAVHKLERAVSLYPEYSAARVNLGVQYTRQGRRQDALEQFEKAVASGDTSAIVYGNLAHAYYSLGRLTDAEFAARRAVSLDTHYLRGHYLLGSILAKSVRPGVLDKAPEAARHLRIGAEDVPRAHIEIGQIYLAEEDPFSAAAEFRLYLQSGEKEAREKVERWLATFHP